MMSAAVSTTATATVNGFFPSYEDDNRCNYGRQEYKASKYTQSNDSTKIQLLLPRLPVVLDREWNIRLLPRISFHRSVRNLIADLWEFPLNEVVSGFLLWLWGRCGLLANTRSGSNACWVQLGERRNDVVVDVGLVS